jgi:hypothetical protein
MTIIFVKDILTKSSPLSYMYCTSQNCCSRTPLTVLDAQMIYACIGLLLR